MEKKQKERARSSSMDPSENISLENEEADPRIARRYAKMMSVKGRPWFFRMSGDRTDTGLVGYYGKNYRSYGLVIATDVKGMTGSSKRFAYFANISDFYCETVLQRLDAFGGNHYYEVIGATTPEQKPYFDIDIDPTKFFDDQLTIDSATVYSKEIINLILATIRAELSKLLVDHRLSYTCPISVYRTEYPLNVETGLPKKFSYHLVCQGVYFADHEQMKLFGEIVKKAVIQTGQTSLGGEILAGLASDAIDVIWHKTRQFRLMGSSKLGSTAAKTRVVEGTLEPDPNESTSSDHILQELKSSCVSIIDRNCLLVTVPSVNTDDNIE